MSEQTDDAQKTEEPTQKRLDEARRRGQVAVSREVNTWLLLLAGALVIAMITPWIMMRLRGALLPYVEAPHLFRLDLGAAMQRLEATLFDVFVAVFLPLLLLFIAALLGPILQNGLIFSPKAMEMKLEKFSPVQGAKRIFSMRQLIEFPKGIVKLAVVGAQVVAAGGAFVFARSLWLEPWPAAVAGLIYALHPFFASHGASSGQ